PTVGTRSNPLPMGTTAQITLPADSPKTFEITTLESYRGAEAIRRIKAGTYCCFNDPDPGVEYILMRLRVRYLAGPQNASVIVGQYGDLEFISSGADGIVRKVAPVYSPLPSFDAQPDFGVRMVVGGTAE